MDALSDYYDELSVSSTTQNVEINKERMKYLREQILKKTFEAKNLIRRIEIKEQPQR